MQNSKFFAILIFAITLFGFTNCDRVNFSTLNSPPQQNSNSSAASNTDSGNGDGYGGKPTIFDYSDNQNPCKELSTRGRPLPNSQIFKYSNKASLTRKECQDITPISIATSDVTMQLDGSLNYSGQSFLPSALNEFDLKVPNCPSGMMFKPVVQHNNLLYSPLDLTDSSAWDTMQNSIAANLFGSFGGLPMFRVSRNVDASVQTWLRLNEYILLSPNRHYAFSFFARADNAPELSMLIYDSAPLLVDVGVTWNLTTGAVMENRNVGLLEVATSATPVAGGFFFTYYFKTNSMIRGLDIGFAPKQTSIGNSIFAAGAQLEDMDSICMPSP